MSVRSLLSRVSPLVLALIVLPLAGCLSLGDDGKTRVYAPTIATTSDDAWPQADWTLLLAKPRAGSMLDSERIAVQPEPGQLQVYKESIWADSVPEMMQAALLRAFEDSGKITAVARQASGVRGDATLMIDIRHFEAIYTDRKSPPTVTVEVQAKLVVQPAGRVIAAKTFRSEVAASNEKVPAVTQAFDAASSQLIAELLPWVLAQKPKPVAKPVKPKRSAPGA